MTTLRPLACDDTTPHQPHIWDAVPGATGALVSCPGRDPEPLAPDRDRDQTETSDWTPEVLHLTDAAAIVVRAYQTGPNNRPSPAYYGAMAVWRELTGMDEPTALTWAYSIATLPTPVTGAVIPF